jgi:hypothetical protein
VCLPLGCMAWSPDELVCLGQALSMMLTSSPNSGQRTSNHHLHHGGSDSSNMIFDSKGNHFRRRMFNTCARLNFGSFPIVSFDFEGIKRSQMQLHKL